MVKLIKKLRYFLIMHTGIIDLIQKMYVRLLGNKIVFLFTHRVIDKEDALYPLLKILGVLSVDKFEEHIRRLKKHFKFINIKEALEYIEKGRIPANYIVLTIDDGYKSNYDKVFPVLRKLNIPATIFVAAKVVNDGKILWYDKLMYAIYQTKKTEISLSGISEKKFITVSLKDKKRFYIKVCSLLKKMKDEKKDEILEQILKKLEYEKNCKTQERLMLNWDEIREMHKSGFVEFGSHAMNHRILTKISIKDVEQELICSKRRIEKHLGNNVEFFAYPNGDYNEEIIEKVKKCGYKAAFSINIGVDNRNEKNRFNLKRIGFDDDDFDLFILKLVEAKKLFLSMIGKYKSDN